MSISALEESYLTHMKEALQHARICVYGVFAMTFTFYFAFLSNQKFRNNVADLDIWTIAAILVAGLGNLGWWYFFRSSTDRAVNISQYLLAMDGRSRHPYALRQLNMEIKSGYAHSSLGLLTLYYLIWAAFMMWAGVIFMPTRPEIVS